jgi:hypothetical protein
MPDLCIGFVVDWQALLHVLCGAAEYDELPVRHNEVCLNFRTSPLNFPRHEKEHKSHLNLTLVAVYLLEFGLVIPSVIQMLWSDAIANGSCIDCEFDMFPTDCSSMP